MMHENSQEDFGNLEQPKMYGSRFLTFTNREKCIEVDLSIHGWRKMYRGRNWYYK
jgi:hypothetical protein